MEKENKIVESWKANADQWIRLIETNGIESRRVATNNAIVDLVCSYQPATALDIGCGEGWLSQQLADKGVAMSGIDIVPELIKRAKQKAKGDFRIASYQEINERKISFPVLFDAIVINFALIGKESTENLLTALPFFLSPKGKLFIQTLHPGNIKTKGEYKTGWKEGSWDGLAGDFTHPYQWYFRTMEDWLILLSQSGFKNCTVLEINHPGSGMPLSVIFTCSPS